MAAYKRGCLKDGLEKANDHNLPGVITETSPQGQESPGNHAAWKVDTRLKFLKRKVVRNLPQYVTAVKDYWTSMLARFRRHHELQELEKRHTRVDDIQLLPMKVEVLLHATNICIVQIGTVKVVYPVHETAKGQNDRVELQHKPSLCLCWCGLSPDDMSNFGEYRHCEEL